MVAGVVGESANWRRWVGGGARVVALCAVGGVGAVRRQARATARRFFLSVIPSNCPTRHTTAHQDHTTSAKHSHMLRTRSKQPNQPTHNSTPAPHHSTDTVGWFTDRTNHAVDAVYAVHPSIEA